MSYWQKQASDKPLFPELLWSRPENRLHAGKLLIIGGNASGFSRVASAYQASLASGVGTVRVALPDALARTVGKIFPEAEFVPSTPSGSFGQKALAELLEMSRWADGVLLAGELGRNSETVILLEKFAAKYPGQLTIVGDALDYFLDSTALASRAGTTVVASLAQLQKIAQTTGYDKAFTSGMDLLRMVETLHEFTSQTSLNIVLEHLENCLVASHGKISSTKLANLDKLAPSASVWWLQNPDKTFEALTSAVYESIN